MSEVRRVSQPSAKGSLSRQQGQAAFTSQGSLVSEFCQARTRLLDATLSSRAGLMIYRAYGRVLSPSAGI